MPTSAGPLNHLVSARCNCNGISPGWNSALVASHKHVSPKQPGLCLSVADSSPGPLLPQVLGHFASQLDPLGLEKRPEQVELDPAFYGFTEMDLDREWVMGLAS